uniref:Ribosomal RNA small subunit methyltransferase A n=1 Tax=candidate division WOR-3 bacterium TaxID=2052148 RepID=A0A7C4Y5U6_UNCW3
MKVQEIVKVLEGIRLKKSRGQNFLINKKIAEKIVDLLNIKEDERILEIGPGLGSLTDEIIKKGGRPFCIEIEKRFCDFLKVKYGKKIEIINDDFLKMDPEDLKDFRKCIGALPYRGAKKIIMKILLEFENIKTAVFCVQKEIADIIVSDKNSKNYSPLSVIAHLRCEAKKIMNVSPDFFYPKPGVISTVVLMDFKKGLIDYDFYRFLCVVFKQRRKTIGNNLKGIINIDIKKRAEELNPQEIFSLYESLKDYFKV